MRVILCTFLILLGCQQKQTETSTTEADTTLAEVSPQDAYETPNEYDYREFYGVYDHESNSKGFSAGLSLRQNGNDVYFTVSVVQGDCKGEIEGVVMMMDHTQLEHSGFYESEDCRLQITINRVEKKVDVKEISLCRLLGPNCSFEGVYLKRID